MRIGFDLHGVIDRYVEEFKQLTTRLKTGIPELGAKFNISWEIFVVSGPPLDDLQKELDDLGLVKGKHYDDAFSIVTYLKEKNVPMWQDDRGRWWANNEDWWSSKAEICAKNSIVLLIDDTEHYRKACTKHGIGFVKIGDDSPLEKELNHLLDKSEMEL